MAKRKSVGALVLGAHLAKKKRLPKFQKVGDIRAEERKYKRKLYPIVALIATLVRERLLPRLPALFESYQARHPALSITRADSIPAPGDDDELKRVVRIIEEIRVAIGRHYSEEEIEEIARATGASVAEFSDRVLREGLKRVVGVDVLGSEPWLAQQVETFAASNADLITRMSADAISRVKGDVLAGFMNGSRWEEVSGAIAEYIDPLKGSVKSRADLIARDQIASLNGQLNELRQTDLGIARYIWRTSLDERVRDSHRVKEGKIFDWNDPPADTGHPGEDYNCRCTAEPYLEDLLGDAGATTGVDITGNEALAFGDE